MTTDLKPIAVINPDGDYQPGKPGWLKGDTSGAQTHGPLPRDSVIFNGTKMVPEKEFRLGFY